MLDLKFSPWIKQNFEVKRLKSFFFIYTATCCITYRLINYRKFSKHLSAGKCQVNSKSQQAFQSENKKKIKTKLAVGGSVCFCQENQETGRIDEVEQRGITNVLIMMINRQRLMI